MGRGQKNSRQKGTEIRHHRIHGKDDLVDSVEILHQPVSPVSFLFGKNWGAIRGTDGNKKTML